MSRSALSVEDDGFYVVEEPPLAPGQRQERALWARRSVVDMRGRSVATWIELTFGYSPPIPVWNARVSELVVVARVILDPLVILPMEPEPDPAA